MSEYEQVNEFVLSILNNQPQPNPTPDFEREERKEDNE